MTDQSTTRTAHQSAGHRPVPGVEEPSSWAIGAIVFAAVTMIMIGMFQVIAGVTALVENEFYVVAPNYVFELNVTTWGWIHLIAGLVVGLAGFGVLRGNLAARVVGIALAAVSAILNFAFIPYYPLWSITIIALDVFVIWALSMHGRDLRP